MRDEKHFKMNTISPPVPKRRTCRRLHLPHHTQPFTFRSEGIATECHGVDETDLQATWAPLLPIHGRRIIGSHFNAAAICCINQASVASYFSTGAINRPRRNTIKPSPRHDATRAYSIHYHWRLALPCARRSGERIILSEPFSRVWRHVYRSRILI